MPTLPNMSLITPTLGADSGAWDDKINACLELVDAHDHTPGKGVLVPVAGLDIDDDVDLGGLSLIGTGSVDFTAVAALSDGQRRLFVNSANNELYWRTQAGTNVKLTNGTSINTTLVGGIVGDYSSVGAEVAYDDSNDRYTFKQETATWARLASGPVRIYEFNTTESVYVELAVAAALAASYTVTLPAALPGATAFVTITSAGIAAFTSSPTTTGTITAAEYLFTGDHVKVFAAGALAQTGSTHVFNGNYWALGNSNSDTLYASLTMNVGDRIKSVKVYADKNSDATNTVTVEVFRIDPATSGGIATSLGTASDNSNAGGVVSTLIVSGLTATVAAAHAYSVAIYQSDATPSSSDFIFTVEVTYDRPV